MTDANDGDLAAPKVVDRAAFQAEVDALRIREKAHTHEGDAIAAARRGFADGGRGSRDRIIGANSALTLLDASGL